MVFIKKACLLICFYAVASGCSLALPHQSNLNDQAVDSSNQQYIRLCGLDAVAQRNAMNLQWDFMREEKNFRIVPFWYYDYAHNTNIWKNDLILGEAYFQKHPFDHDRTIVLIPGTGEDISTVGTAGLLARQGFDVIRFRSGIDILDRNEIAKKEIINSDDLRVLARKGASVIKARLCDYVAIINYFDRSYRYEDIGVSGVSLGGIYASLIAYEHPKVHATLMMITGGNIAEILRTSTEKGIVQLRNMLLERFDGTTKEFWQILSQELADIDPAYHTRYIDRSHMHLIANYWDTVIQYQYAKELRFAWGDPEFEVIGFPPGHYGSVFLLWIPMIRWEIYHAGPVPYLWPSSVETVKKINLEFFTKTLPIH